MYLIMYYTKLLNRDQMKTENGSAVCSEPRSQCRQNKSLVVHQDKISRFQPISQIENLIARCWDLKSAKYQPWQYIGQPLFLCMIHACIFMQLTENFIRRNLHHMQDLKPWPGYVSTMLYCLIYTKACYSIEYPKITSNLS